MQCKTCDPAICASCLGSCCSFAAYLTPAEAVELSEDPRVAASIEMLEHEPLALVSEQSPDVAERVKGWFSRTGHVGKFKRGRMFAGVAYCDLLGRRSDGSGYCTIYDRRPEACREFHQDRCITKRVLINDRLQLSQISNG